MCGVYDRREEYDGFGVDVLVILPSYNDLSDEEIEELVSTRFGEPVFDYNSQI
jgi:hypothetical protein